MTLTWVLTLSVSAPPLAVPSPSTSVQLTLRVPSVGLSPPLLLKVMPRIRSWTSAGVAGVPDEVKVMSRSPPPAPPPLKVAKTRPPDSRFEPFTVTAPVETMPSWSSAATRPVPRWTVSEPPVKSVLSMSATVRLVPTSSFTALPPSVQTAMSPLRFVEVGASLTGVTVSVSVIGVPIAE